jgi:two-component system, cell cycle response regulator
MKDTFKTRKMQTIPLPAPPEAAGTQPSSSGQPSSSQRGPASSQGRVSAPIGPPSSDGSWTTGDAATERATDPAMSVPEIIPSGKDRATLTVLAGINAGQVYALDGTEHHIGRGTEADIWVEDTGVSRRHARITCRSDGRYFVEDLGSTNGTFIGSQRVDLCEIRPGDRIQIGPHVTLRFQITDDAEEELQRRLYESSTRDALTRVYNRKYFTERLTAEVAYSRRHRVKLAVLILDLDDFKSTNDTFGHLAGDMVLRLVSAQMQRLIRVEDLLARYGGEEFVILARTTGKTEAQRLGDRMREAISKLEIPVTADRSISVTISAGVAALPDVAPDGGPNELLALADARLYRAKAEGKNRVCADGEG